LFTSVVKMKSTRDRSRSWILQTRKLVGWTQFDLAKNADIGRTRLSLYECGHVDLRPSELAVVVDSLEKAAAARVNAIRSVSGVTGRTNKGR
jgi:predicted transcriptional regulator